MTVQSKPDEPADYAPVIDIARSTLRGDVRDHLLDFIKHNKSALPFNQLPEQQQRDLVDRAEGFSDRLVEAVAAIVAADGRTEISCGVKKVESVKEGIRLQLVTPFDDDAWMQMGSAQRVVICSVETRPYRGERRLGAAHVTPDQGRLPVDDGGPEPEPDSPAAAGEEAPVFDQTKAGKRTKGMGRGKKPKGDELEIPASIDKRPGSEKGTPDKAGMEALIETTRGWIHRGFAYEEALAKAAVEHKVKLNATIIALVDQALGRNDDEGDEFGATASGSDGDDESKPTDEDADFGE